MGEGKSGKFESASHYELYEMVRASNPTQLSDAGLALMTAYTDLDGIADEMLAHADNVRWKGTGSESFRTWVEEMSKQTRKMADYTLLVGTNMSIAGQGLSDVKSAMPKPDTMCYADEEKEKARLKNAEPNRQEAIKQIEKLDSYYTTAQTDISGLDGPN
ncbi:MAG: hypothetical protein HOY75_17120, partial [Streptomyces sp.]|nr:hypothetical protein [Streptomyces sp.]